MSLLVLAPLVALSCLSAGSPEAPAVRLLAPVALPAESAPGALLPVSFTEEATPMPAAAELPLPAPVVPARPTPFAADRPWPGPREGFLPWRPVWRHFDGCGPRPRADEPRPPGKPRPCYEPRP